MKKLPIIFFSLICLNAVSQKKDTVKVDTVYTLTLKKTEFDFILYLITLQDEKPSTVRGQIEYIRSKSEMILPKKK